MNQEILNQDGIDESLAEYIRSNVKAEPITEEIIETNEELEIEESEIEESLGEIEEVEDPTIEDVVFDENEDTVEE